MTGKACDHKWRLADGGRRAGWREITYRCERCGTLAIVAPHNVEDFERRKGIQADD